MNLAFLAPLAGLAALALPLIVILHMRQARPKPLPITTMRFWEEAVRNRRRRLTPRRPPRSLLLLLQLLVAGLLALALARPALPLPGLPGNAAPRQLIVILDRSTAMRATDVAPTRYEAARERARALIAAADAEETVTLLTLGADPRTLRSRDAGDRPTLLAALAALGPGGGRADLNAALPTLRAILLPGRENTIVVLSAGVFAAAPDRAALAALPATLRWERSGAAADNLAITTLVARRSVLASDRVELFARVANYSAVATAARGRIEVDGTEVDSRPLQLAANGTLELVWQLPPGARGARLRVEPTGGATDALPLDNEAQVVTRETSQRRILLVSDTPGALGRALAAQPGAALTTVSTGAYAPDRESYDLTVLDNFLPAALPRGGLFIVNPPADSSLLPSSGFADTPKIARVDRESPLVAGVDLSGLTFAPGAVYERPTWATEIVGAEKGPLILAGNRDGREIVALTFDLARSNLPRKLAFPLLVGNIVDHLQTHRVPTAAPLGQGILLEPVAGTRLAQLRDPTGATRDLDLRESAGGVPTVYAVPDRPGLYALIERDGTGSVILQESFAVNGGDTITSNLGNVATDLPTGAGGVAPDLPAAAPAAELVPAPRRLGELWPVLVALALILLLLEWAVGLAGPAPPRGRLERVRPRPGLISADRGTRSG